MQHKNISQTETLRFSLFQDTNQDEWTKHSAETRDAISKMVDDGKNLFELYEFARRQRRKLAEKFKHTNQEDDEGKYWFGIIRETQVYGDYFDIYAPHKFAASEQDDDSLYKRVLEIVAEQSESFKIRKILSENENRLTLRWLSGSGVSANSDKERIIQYQTHLRANEGSVSRNYYKKEIFKEGAWQEQPDIIAVIIRWGDMDHSVYKNKINEFNVLFDEIKKCEPKSRECLKKLGYLAYDLSVLLPCGRGSAFNAGITIKGIVSAKGFPEVGGNMHVHGLPFDVYAHLQGDRDRYAEEFANDLARDFNLLPGHKLNQAL